MVVDLDRYVEVDRQVPLKVQQYNYTGWRQYIIYVVGDTPSGPSASSGIGVLSQDCID